MSFTEKMGEMLASMGKRCLIGLLSTVIGVLVCVIPILPISFIGLALFLSGFFTMVSLIETNKCRYLKTMVISDSQGRSVKCGLVEVEEYAFMPVVPFVCPFFYIPYRTRYFLIKNIGDGIEDGTSIDGGILNYPIFDLERIYKQEYSRMKNMESVVNDKLVEGVYSGRQAFIAEFDANESIEQFFISESIVIYKIYEDLYIMYNGCNSGKIGISLAKIEAEQLADLGDGWFRYILEYDTVSIRNKMRRLQREMLGKIKEVKEKTDETTEMSYRDSANSLIRKTKITEVHIKEVLKRKYCSKGGKFGAGVLFFLAVGALEFAVFSIVVLMIPAVLICLAIAALLIYWGVKILKSHKTDLAKIEDGQYKIIKKPCIGKHYEEHEDYDVYCIDFEGEEIIVPQNEYQSVVEGDEFYLLYLEGEKQNAAYYRDVKYELSDELEGKVEE